jgi:hypothetical protein
MWNPIDGDKPETRFRGIQDFVRRNYKDETPEDHHRVYKCEVEVHPGCKLTAYVWGHHVFVQNDEQSWHPYINVIGHRGYPEQADEPFITARIVSEKAYAKKVTKTREVPDPDAKAPWRNRKKKEEYQVEDTYRYNTLTRNYYNDDFGHTLPYAYLRIEITAKGSDPTVGEFKYKLPTVGKATLNPHPDSGEVTVEVELLGLTGSWTESVHPVHQRVKRENHWHNYYDDYRNNPFSVLMTHLEGSDCSHDMDEWWRRFFDGQKRTVDSEADNKGLVSLYKRKAFKDNIARLKTDSPIDWMFFRWLHDGRTKDKQRNNTLIGTMLKLVAHDYDLLVKTLREARADAPKRGHRHEGYRDGKWFDFRRRVCLNLPGAKEKVEEQEAKADFRKAKSRAKAAEVLGIDKAKYPTLFRYVEGGYIPTSVFANPNGQPVNREFSLWEKALKTKGWAEEICKIAADAGRRSTYSKDITPFLSFLYKLPKYLDRHTEGRKKWRAMPKYVESQWELEMGEENETGTTKRRSAFTPVADNDERVVTVPYVAVCVTGVRTQWCYSDCYYVFEENMIDPVSDGVVVNEIEKKLNGRDDYGLMFFTLIGTDTATGYPTFLIIFERREQGTHVHFHRVHPKRKTKGFFTPACELIERCYQYMAGNVPASEVAAQQGDMIYIRYDSDPIKNKAKVEEPQVSTEALVFESHSMVPIHKHVETTFKLYVSTAKTPKNRLGFLHVDQPWKIQHPEHDDIEEMGAGWWEVRRCRSWEANPKAIWSLTID